VTFLDFGLVRRFTAEELEPLMQMARYLCVDHDPEEFRRNLVKAGFLRADAPLSTDEVVEHMAVFYDTVRESRPLTMTGDYSSAVVRRFFDVRSPVTTYAQIPRSYVILHRQLARHRRGDLALRPRPAHDPDRRGRGRLA
jgi:hypothetical protein